MNYIIKTDEKNEEKIIIPQKNYYCSNCNKKGHMYKNCIEPIISNGIISIYIPDFPKEKVHLLEDYLLKNLKKNSNKNENNNYYKNLYNHFWLENDFEINLEKINKSIQFLMVQRKNSLGYLEFMRGRYNFEKISSLTYLLEQMSPNELEDIYINDFDNLWNKLWDTNNIRNKNHYKEYLISKNKFDELKSTYINILINTKPLFNFNEWGFPKGRREIHEPDLVCAIREFKEETTFTDGDYIVYEKCKSIRENLTGTNGIEYAHNYFLSILNKNNLIKDESNREIGQTGMFDLKTCLEKIRPYHINKIIILKYLYMFINNFLSENYLYDENKYL